jgi:UDP-N-acetylglucosamine 1-carboxyvinyltransferase
MRASIVVLGPILARHGYAKISMPGGDAIGARPLDLHLKGLEAMGAAIEMKNGFIEAQAAQLKGAHIYLDFPSVGATQNILMAATLAKGTTIIENAAREPEIVDLANILNKMGAKIRGAGMETIRIEGVESMHAAQHTVVQDRIEAGTFMIAAAITGGDVFIKEAIYEHNIPLLSKLEEMGATVINEITGVRVIGPEVLKPTNIKTMPYPGFPTDLQAQMTVALAVAGGVSTMKETVFENRYQHLEEMRRMNLAVEIKGSIARISSKNQLQGAQVVASDVRAGAALILTGLLAEGLTSVSGLSHLDRGYYQFEKKLQGLGANIERVLDSKTPLPNKKKELFTV